MTGFIVSVFPFRNRVSSKEAFEGLELGEEKPSRPVLRGPGGRKAAWLLGSYSESEGSLGHSGLLSPGLSGNRTMRPLVGFPRLSGDGGVDRSVLQDYVSG